MEDDKYMLSLCLAIYSEYVGRSVTISIGINNVDPYFSGAFTNKTILFFHLLFVQLKNSQYCAYHRAFSIMSPVHASSTGLKSAFARKQSALLK